MNAKNIKPLILAGVILLCSSVLGSFLIGSSILAQEEIEKYGEIAGGKSDSIPIKLKVGEMVRGEIKVLNERLRLSIADYTGTDIHDFELFSTRGSFYYAAESDGQHYIVVTNPDRFSVGTRGYVLTYNILPTDLAPGTGSGKATGEKSITPWIIAGVSAAGVISLVIFIRRKKEKAEQDSYKRKHYDRWVGYSIEQLEEELSRIRSKKRELEHRLGIFSKAAPKVVLGDEDHFHYDSIESQMQDIKWKLEERDREEDDIRRVLRDKRAKPKGL